jgi:hypothetical protein
MSSSRSGSTRRTKYVVFCVPTLKKPYQPTLDSLRDMMPEITAAGWKSGMVSEIDNAYISAARATMCGKAIRAGATDIVFIDHDVSWPVGTMLKLLEAPGDVVGGTYRFKQDEEKYMGTLFAGTRWVDKHGRIKMVNLPGGFLRVTRRAVKQLMRAFPELIYGRKRDFDLFNHGAYKGVWWGEDYAFCRRWLEIGEDVWCLPDLDITHHSPEQAYPGNFHEFLMRCPGGSKSSSVRGKSGAAQRSG